MDNQLLDFLLRELEFTTDKQIADLLEVGVSAISKIRHGKNVSPEIILRIHERTDIPVRTIREQIQWQICSQQQIARQGKDIAVIVYNKNHRLTDIGKHMKTVNVGDGFVQRAQLKGYGKKQALWPSS